MPKRILMQCATPVNRDAIRREAIDGVEHIIVTSLTLPPDIVMNSILYPAAEVTASFHTLERTLAPVEHPTDADGMFISASDPTAIHNFYAGAFNVNVQQAPDGRIRIDKMINVQQAKTTDRGKRLLDRIAELETNDKARPIHTSVGVWIEVEETDGPQTEFNGMATNAEFTGIARQMVFDHDAVLLDTVAAATPGQGVGMAVNAQGEEYEVQRFVVDAEHTHLDAGGEELSHQEIQDLLYDAIRRPPMNGDWIVRVFNDTFIFEVGDEMFQVPYIVADGVAKITGIPLPVVRDESFTPRVNRKGDEMKELLLAALAAAKVETDGLDDDALLAAYNTLMAANAEGGDAPTIAEQIATALEPMTAALADIKTQLSANGDAELETLAKTVSDSGLYPDLDADSAKLLGVEKLKEMAANCQPSFGVNGHMAPNHGGSEETAEMPD